MGNNIKNFFRNRRMVYIVPYILLVVAAVVVVAALIPKNYSYFSSSQDAIVSYTQSYQNAAQANEYAKASLPKETSSSVPVQSFVRNGNKEVNTLIENYCNALTDGNEDILAKYTDSVNDIDEFYRNVFAEYIEEVTDINCYTMNGMLSGTYIVLVTYNVKYEGYDTILPGTLYCYVCTDASGNLYVSNKEPGDDVSSYNDMMYKSSAVSKIVANTAEEHDKKLESDEELAAFIAEFSKQ